MGQKRTVKDYPRLFGAIAEKKGSITEEQLTKALKIQGMEDREKKAHRVIGIILYDEGLMTTEQINEVHKSLLAHRYMKLKRKEKTNLG